jgi:hypothetical protein
VNLQAKLKRAIDSCFEMFRYRLNTPFFYNTPSKEPKKDMPDAGGYKGILPYG